MGSREGDFYRASVWLQNTGAMDPGDEILDLVPNEEMDLYEAGYPSGTVFMDLIDWTGETTLPTPDPRPETGPR
jgi:hypothetical protein